MNPVRLIARLTAKSQGFMRGLGGATFTDEDVQLAVALLPEGARLLARVKYLGDRTSEPALLNYVTLKTLCDAPRARWTAPKGQELRAIIETAIFETVNPKLCGTCGGMGFVPVAKQKRRGRRPKFIRPLLKQCPVCEGAGTRATSDYWRWRRAGINQRRWAAYMKAGYMDVILPILAGYEQAFYRGMRRRLRP